MRRLNGLQFVPPPNFNGIALLTVTVDDLGASGVGPPKTSGANICQSP